MYMTYHGARLCSRNDMYIYYDNYLFHMLCTIGEQTGTSSA